MYVVAHKPELCPQAVSVHLNFVPPLIQTKLQLHLARLQAVHVASVHGEHVTQPLNLFSRSTKQARDDEHE